MKDITLFEHDESTTWRTTHKYIQILCATGKTNTHNESVQVIIKPYTNIAPLNY